MLLYQSLVRAALVGKCHILWCSTHAGKVAPIARGQSFPKKSQVQGSKNATAQKPGEDIFHSAILNISALSYLMVAKWLQQLQTCSKFKCNMGLEGS